MNKYFAKIKEIKCIDTEEICIGYDNYLKSKHWYILRKRLIPKNMKCSMCGEVSDSLQLHHLTYKHIGNETDSDLIPVCEDCHKLLHKIPKEHIKSELYVKPKQKHKSKKKMSRCCKNCRYYTIMTIKGKKSKKEPYCNYFAKFNPTQICEHFRYKNK